MTTDNNSMMKGFWLFLFISTFPFWIVVIFMSVAHMVDKIDACGGLGKCIGAMVRDFEEARRPRVDDTVDIDAGGFGAGEIE